MVMTAADLVQMREIVGPVLGNAHYTRLVVFPCVPMFLRFSGRRNFDAFIYLFFVTLVYV